MVGITKMKAEKQKAEKEAFFCTTKELSRLGLEQIPTQFQSHKHSDLQFAGYTGIQFTGSRRLWREACRSCSTRFHYVDRGSGVLWKKYFTDQFDEGI